MVGSAVEMPDLLYSIQTLPKALTRKGRTRQVRLGFHRGGQARQTPETVRYLDGSRSRPTRSAKSRTAIHFWKWRSFVCADAVLQPGDTRRSAARSPRPARRAAASSGSVQPSATGLRRSRLASSSSRTASGPAASSPAASSSTASGVCRWSGFTLSATRSAAAPGLRDARSPAGRRAQPQASGFRCR